MHYNGAMCTSTSPVTYIYCIGRYTGHKEEYRGTIYRSSLKLGTTIGEKHSSEFASEVAPLASSQSTDRFWKVITELCTL